ncbi:MAG: calcium/sodium antiporter [Gammaproteobacteria bacterium CG22_combo_CG10-13_8_21_14_all_40_8]|nr:MAG: calcium/sodium antiporter [Gammaproteobacteria bacterium CG22_combo_CG10-13_8_21_14_all_40_8]
MLFDLAYILIGLAILIWSADKLTEGSAALAKNFGIPSLIIGLTIIAIGSSAPEMVVSAVAAIGGSSNLAIGNAIGSNITNIALVLGVTALITPLLIHSDILKREIPILIFLNIFASFLIWYHGFTRADGWILVLTLGIYLTWLVITSLKKRKQDLLLTEIVDELPQDMSNSKAALWIILGLALLIFSSDLLVMGATNLATRMGVSELVIGLTVVAVGTSLPELAASIASAIKKEHDMAIGNIIGSNIFNILGVMGVAGIIHPPTSIPAEVFYFHLPAMLIITIALFFLSLDFGKGPRLAKSQAIILLSGFVAFNWLLVTQIHTS